MQKLQRCRELGMDDSSTVLRLVEEIQELLLLGWPPLLLADAHSAPAPSNALILSVSEPCAECYSFRPLVDRRALMGWPMSGGRTLLRDAPLSGPSAVGRVRVARLFALSGDRSRRVFMSVQKVAVGECAVCARCTVHSPCLGRSGGASLACFRHETGRLVTAVPLPPAPWRRTVGDGFAVGGCDEMKLSVHGKA